MSVRRLPTSLTAQLLYGQLIVGGTALVVNVLAARALDPTQRGQLALGIQLSYLLSVLVLLGVDKAYPAVSGTVGIDNAVREITRLLAVPAAVVIGVCSVAGLVLASISADGLVLAVGVGLLALTTSATVAIRSGAIAARRAGIYLRSVVAGQALLLGSCLLLLALPGAGPVPWLLAYGLCTALPVAAVLRSRRLVRPERDPLAPERLDRVRRLRRRVAPSTISSLAMLRLDRLLIPVLASERDLGFYIVVATMTELLYWPLLHYVDSHVPLWRERAASGSLRVARPLVTCVLYTALAGVTATLVVTWAVVPLFGPAYEPSRSLVLPLVAAACAYGVSRVAVGLCIAAGRAGSASVSDGVGVVVLVVACVVLVPTDGAAGAAIGSLLAYLTAAGASLLVVATRWRPDHVDRTAGVASR